jgi:23S rRNA pseudouridine1911/1915/1917 synthase
VKETVPAALEGERVDRVVAMLTGRPRAEVAELVSTGAVRLRGRPVTARSARVTEGDELEVELPPDDPLAGIVQPEVEVEVEVVYEDDDVLVVDKAPELVVHPGAGYESLVGQLSSRTVERRYAALVWGHPTPPQGMIDAPLGRSRRDPTRMAVSASGREARTSYGVEREFTEPVETALLTCTLETGRTHQIRVHLAAIGHPIVGDPRYRGARRSFPAPRTFLHAGRLAFDHPRTGERVVVEAPLPDDLGEVLARLS